MNPPPAKSNHPSRSKLGHHQAGVGLIEILIAVVVLAVGILGLAAVQTRALSDSSNSMARSMATVATYSITEAMLTDRINAFKGDYDGPVTASSCDPAGASLASIQRHDWCEQLGQSLGATADTTGNIDCDAATGHCTVTVSWGDNSTSAAAGGGKQSLVTNVALPPNL